MNNYFKKDRVQLAVLVDPDHQHTESYERLLVELHRGYADLILVGGSTSARDNIDTVCQELKAVSQKPIISFPGNHFQLTRYADAVMALSLISGRNPEYLIGKMVEAAPIIAEYGLKVIPTGYIMIADDSKSATSYITGTQPIPMNQPLIAAHTALAGVMLGMQCIYLEAGSGAAAMISESTISAVRNITPKPLIVGGGIRKVEQVTSLAAWGVDVIVIGSVLEKQPESLEVFYQACNSYKITP